MADPFAHTVKFARSLAMTSTLVLGACGGAAESGDDAADDPAPVATAEPATPAHAVRVAPVAPMAAAGNPKTLTVTTPAPDPSGGPPSGHLSGPLPPPEMPASFA